ncbi:MAG: MFS transporter [Chloroflexota bacterium]
MTQPTGHTGDPASPRLLTGAFAALFAAALAFFTSGGMVLPVASRFANGPLGADAVGVGVSIGVFAIAALALRPVVGWASDRFGRRPLLLLGGGITVAALAAHLLVDALPAFIVVRALLGTGEALFFVAALAALSDLAPPGRRGEAINVGSLSVYLGLGIGPLVGESVLAAGGFDATWLAAAVVAGVATGLSVLVPETAPAVLAAAAGGGGPRPRARLVHPAGILPGFLILTGAWGMAGFFAFIPLHAPEAGLDGAGILLAMYAVIVIALRVVFAKLPDQVGTARLSGAALAVSAIGLAMIGILSGPIGLLAGTAVFAIGIAFMFPALMALAVSRVPEDERGSVVGTSSAFLDLSFGLGPASLGFVAGASSYGVAFVVAAAVAALGAIVIVVFRRSLEAPAPAPGG